MKGFHLALEKSQVVNALREFGGGHASLKYVLSFPEPHLPPTWVWLPQVLLKAFIANLKSSSPTVRRTAAGSVVSICQHSRRTQYFYSWLLSVLLGEAQPARASPRGVGAPWQLPEIGL